MKQQQRGLNPNPGNLKARPPKPLLLMIEILHYLKDPKLWELWYIPYYGYCRMYTINCNTPNLHFRPQG